MAPSDVVVHGGTAYVADALYDIVRAVDLTSGVATVALAPDRPLPAEAQFPASPGAMPSLEGQANPMGLAADGSGTLIVSDRARNRIRRLAPDGTVVDQPLPTVADARCLYRLAPASSEPQCVARLTASPVPGPNAGPAAFASYPDVVVDAAGAVLYTDPSGHVVRRLAGGTDEVLAGTGRSGCGSGGPDAAASALSLPIRLALGSGGAVLFSEEGCHRIRRVGGAALQPVLRLAGLDRVATAVEVSRATHVAGGAGGVVVARADDFADALSGAPLAVRLRGPLLLSHTDRLDPWTESEVRRLLPSGGPVHLLGGAAALDAGVEDRLRVLGYTVTRHAGGDRFSTAVAVARPWGTQRPSC